MVSISCLFASVLAASAAPLIDKRDGDGTIGDQLAKLYVPEDVIQQLYEYSPINDILSAVWAPKGSQSAAPAFYNLLNDQNAAVPAVDANAQNSDGNAPSINELMGAASAAEQMNFYSPGGNNNLQPYNLPNTNKQLTGYDTGTGMKARVFKTGADKLIISFSGWNPLDLPVDLGTYTQDEGSVSGKINEGQKNAVAFARLVYLVAKQEGKTQQDIYVSGHSTGAAEAEYVAQQLGFSGVAFEGTGIPEDSNAVGKGNNFISFVNYGDVWASYASDVPDNPVDVIGGPKTGTLPHYGKLIMVGDKGHADLQSGVLKWFKWTKAIPEGAPITFLIDFINEQGLGYHNMNEDGNLNPYLGKKVGQVV